jgi:oxygen-dependent protoporphyrinogen oxidase
LVVGGGIAGLAAAHRLQRAAEAAGLRLQVTLLEREGRLGGKILTEQAGQFTLEAGPDAFVSTKPWAVQLCRELGLEARLLGANLAQRRVYVLRGGKLQRLPDGLAMMVPARLGPLLASPLLSPRAKARLGLDLVLPARGGEADESLGAFLSRRLGRQAYERLIEPLMSGIYAGDGDRLSLQATFPFLREWERLYGSLTRGAMALARARGRNGRAEAGRSIFLTLTGGLGELVRSLQAALGGAQLLGVAAARILRDGLAYRVQTEAGDFRAEALILATPAFVSAELLHSLRPELSSLLERIEYVSSATVSLAYSQEELPRPLDGHGYVIPRGEGRQALACTWTSTKFPHRAPQGLALLRVFLGRAGQPLAAGTGPEDLIAWARAELRATLGVEAEPRLARAYLWPRSMPQYNLGHPERLGLIQSELAQLPGLFLAGAGYQGVGIPDCIHSGQTAAEAALQHLLGVSPREPEAAPPLGGARPQ